MRPSRNSVDQDTQQSLQALHNVALDFTQHYAPSVAKISREIQNHLRDVRDGLRYTGDLISDKNNDYDKIHDLVLKIKNLKYADNEETRSYRNDIFDLIKDSKYLKESYLYMMHEEIGRLSKEMEKIEEMESELSKKKLKLEESPKPKSRIGFRRSTKEELENINQLKSEISQLESEIDAQNKAYKDCETQLCRIIYNSDSKPEFDLEQNRGIIAAQLREEINNIKSINELLVNGADKLTDQEKRTAIRKINTLIGQLADTEILQSSASTEEDDQEKELESVINEELSKLFRVLHIDASVDVDSPRKQVEEWIENLNKIKKEVKIDKTIDQVVIDTQAHYQQRSALLHSDIRELESELDDLGKQVDDSQGKVKDKITRIFLSTQTSLKKAKELLSTKDQSLTREQESLKTYSNNALEGFIDLCVKDDNVFKHYLQDRTMRSVYRKLEEDMKMISGSNDIEEGFDCTSFKHHLKVMGTETNRVVPLSELFPDFCELINNNKDKIVEEVNRRKDINRQKPTNKVYSRTPDPSHGTRVTSHSAIKQPTRSNSWAGNHYE